MSEPLKVLELFAGIGACSKALDRLRIPHTIVDAVEIDKYAIKSFNAIHSTNFEPQDITKWDKDIDVDLIVEKTNGFNGSDISNLLNHIQDRSFIRAYKEKAKYITMDDVLDGLENVHSTVQADDIEKLQSWKCENDYSE